MKLIPTFRLLMSDTGCHSSRQLPRIRTSEILVAFLRLRGLGVKVRPFILRLRLFFFFFLFFLKWRLACTHQSHFLGRNQSLVAQRAETNEARCSLTRVACELELQIDFHTMPGRHCHSTPTSLGQRVYACLGVTCHLHFRQNERGLLRATAVTRGTYGHRIGVSTQSLTPEKTILPPLLSGLELATFQP